MHQTNNTRLLKRRITFGEQSAKIEILAQKLETTRQGKNNTKQQQKESDSKRSHRP